MESMGYDARDRSLVGVLAGLTYGSLEKARGGQDHAPAALRRGLLAWLDTWLWKQEVKSREAFLAQSIDIVDIEQRMRCLERGRC